MLITAVFVFCFGLVIGSFLNVVILRYNTGRGVGGRSACMTCAKVLRWYELVPLASFLIQKGACRKCKAKLSWQYPLVELSTSIIFLGIFFHFFHVGDQVLNTWLFLEVFIATLSWCILIFITVYDLRHKIIPDGASYTFAFLGLIHILLFVPTQPLSVFIVTLLAGPILFLPFFLLWILSGGRWIGLGDGKLALGIGWMLGLGYGISALFLAFWIGAAVSIVLILGARLKLGASRLTMKSEIPFAPYLILGFAIVYFFALDVANIHGVFGL